ncbi:2'-5'-oligoadenylate synthase 2 [Ochotona curzoniae]|uniref:2'-5'-oligoadenylate synthase 2 n=1 Tax=Ochotona curzoniae TaxID=130825 RepID=UPI001B3512C1|nr:2'-5'-oligoadenylate synthase 2 [Ochotona curzoniae]
MGNSESTTPVPIIPDQDLDEFVQQLKPCNECLNQINQLVKHICTILQKPKYSLLVRDVAMGGSYGRKTVLQGDSSGTLVLFLKCLTEFQDYKKHQDDLKTIANWLKLQLESSESPTNNCKVIESKGRFFVEVFTKHHRICFEMLLAFNALGFAEHPSPCVYRDLKRCLDETQANPGEFAACFTELQQRFFNNYPRKLKLLILLVKYWHRKCQEKWNNDCFPSEYAMELLTVYAWEQGCGAKDFNMAQGVKTVLRLIQQPKRLCVYWTVNYDFEDETIRNILLHQLQATGPVILDPTDPTNNVIRDSNRWFPLLKEAQSLLAAAPNLRSEVPAWNVVSKSLFVTPSHLLDEFIKDFLQPNQRFLDQVEQAIELICKFLQENCFCSSSTKIQKIIKGGSVAQGTALKNSLDANLVVFPELLKTYNFQKTEQVTVLKEIQKQLQSYKKQEQLEKQLEMTLEVCKRKNPRMLSFSLKSEKLDKYIRVDLLPAFNALGQLNAGTTPNPQVYTELLQLYKSPTAFLGGEFASCFTELQCNFITSRPAKLKDLIRLVQHWYQQFKRKLKSAGSLPPKYALDLLTVFAWEQAGSQEDFNAVEGFRTVLELVTQYQHLCVFWKVNYSFKKDPLKTFLLAQLKKTRPVILDPAEPTHDVGGGDRWCWPLLAKEARQWFHSPCFQNEAGQPVQPWKVPVAVV